MDPVALKKQAKELVRKWPEELLNLIDLSQDETISKTPLVDRWLWPGLSPPASKHRVVLVGDAWHPMTPNLGQGGCCALEDAVILARKLADAISHGSDSSVEAAFRSYESERWLRIFPLTIRANVVGSLLQWENPVVCYKMMIPVRITKCDVWHKSKIPGELCSSKFFNKQLHEGMLL